MIGYEDIMKTKALAQIVSATWTISAALVYVIAAPIIEKLWSFMDPMPFDYVPPLNDNKTKTGNSTMFGAWRKDDMNTPIRTYGVTGDKMTVTYTIGNYAFASGGPSKDYKWVYITEKSRMGWSNSEPDPIVTLITSDGFGAICDNICKDK